MDGAGPRATAARRAILWEELAPPRPPSPALIGDREADVAVVGAGYSGLSAALHLAEAGVACLVLEAGKVGAGASGRNNGQVIPGLKLPPADVIARFGPEQGRRALDLADGAADLVFDLIARHGMACQPDRRGWLRAAHAAPAMHKLETTAQQASERGVDLELFDADRTREVLGGGDYAGGLLDRRAGRIDPMGYVRGLAAAAEAAGATICETSPVERIERVSGKWRVTTRGRSVTAEQVVLACGAYGNDCWPGFSNTYLGVRSVQIASRPVPEDLRTAVMPGASAMSDSRKLAHALRLDQAGRVVISGRGPLRDDVSDATLGYLERYATRLYPCLADVGWEYAWAGRIAVTTDELPHLDEPAPGLFTIVGYNGRGVAMATAMGQAIAQHCLGDDDRDAPGYPLRRSPKVFLHGLRLPLIAGAVAYYRMRDGLGLAAN